MNGENDFLNEESLKNLQTENSPGSAKPRPGNGKKNSSHFYGGLIPGMAVSFLIICVVYLAVRIEQRVGFVQGSAAQGSVAESSVLEKMQTIEQIIRYYYYQDEDIDDKALEEGVYRGMLKSLGDPYSEYFSQEELESLMQQTEGIYYGIGAGVQLDPESSYSKIVKVYSGTPAEEAGLRENDIIYKIDGVDTYGMSTTDVVGLIKGEEGTYVNITVVREGESDYLSLDVQRRKVNIPTVEFKMLDDEKAYIQITEFDSITVDQFAEAMAMARGNHMKGLVLDLRGNPGGSLDAVVEVSQMLLPKGLIVYTEDKYGKRQEYSCDGKREIEVPLVVLIDGNSASASEILAGAIKDYGIGTLVGTTTFGKGIVQSIIPLEDNSAVKVTISRYFTPNGNNIHGIGIEPDVECIFDGDAYYNNPDRPDNQLEEAQRVLEELIGE